MTTARHKQFSGSVLTANPPANGHESGSERSSPFSWDEWFRHASPHQRTEVLSLAQQQGLVYPHQLPAVASGPKAAGPATETKTSALLPKLLAGKADALAGYTPKSIECI